MQERFIKPIDEVEGIYRSALASQQLTLRDGGVEDLIKVVLARLSYERRRVEEKEGACRPLITSSSGNPVQSNPSPFPSCS